MSALDAAAARKDRARARALVAPFAESEVSVTREKARRLLVEAFGASAKDFVPLPSATRYTESDYRRLARSVLAALAAPSDGTWGTVRTPRGSFRVDLAEAEAPMTVDSFVSLARRGFFDGLVFHRVVPDFVVQGGDPRGDGSGGPLYAIRDEINPLPYVRGAVGMALSGPDTGGSQWFATLSPQPHLDGGYTVFGRVSDPDGVLDRVEQGDRIERVEIGAGGSGPRRGM